MIPIKALMVACLVLMILQTVSICLQDAGELRARGRQAA